MKTLQEYKTLIEQWSIERNLHTANPKAQFLKVVEEAGEIYEAFESNNAKDFKDAIGDTYVTIVILAQQLNIELVAEEINHIDIYENDLLIALSKLASGLSKNKDVSKDLGRVYGVITVLSLASEIDFVECVELAYNEIKDRKGKMVDGTFVKQEDL